MNLNNRTWEERDEKEFSEREPNPYLTANFISKWSFWWTLKLFRKGYKRPLKDEDIYLHKPSFDAVLLTEKFAQLWDDESKRKHPSIIRLIIKAFGLYFLPLCIGFAILETIAKAIQPYCLGNLISYFSQKDNSITKTQAYMYATGIVISLFPSVLIFHPLMFYVLEIGLRVRVGLSGLIYRKILKVSKSSSSDGLSAKIINVLSNDVSKFDYVFSFVHDALVGPMQVIVLGYLAYLEMGYASFVGIGLLLFFIPIEAWGAKKAGNFHQKTSKRTDFRVKLMNEIILGIQIIKMYAWEKTFAKILKVSSLFQVFLIY
ncbi:ATP-binding cassette sub-family C member 4-like [Condylostylus longicornis]|uniref:ATP-binding cassette sub-family C member 4-like n=1 Tax=Condylostylus longicornis TaxID=2530218 RepID=UPI00244E0EDC|nr:ATP-binding cassette sub-family C member 4-like [Condylostylus longicornis]